jgi:3-phenylpropionate/cinnamic acid dioxygenase small subunit
MIAEEIEMRLAIEDLLTRYCHAVDNGDLEMALGVYWPDGTDRHGDHWNGSGQEYMRDLIGRFGAALPPGSGRRACVHQLTNVLVIRVGADEARVQSSFTAYVPHDREGTPRLAMIIGRFLDRVERRGYEWRIRERTVLNDFSVDDIGGEIYAPGSWQSGGYPAGAFGAADPGVAFLAGREGVE